MKIKFSNKDRDFINKAFDISVNVGKATVGRAIRWLLLGGKWAFLLVIALAFVLMGFIYGTSKIKNVEEEPLGI
jgi:hypothetical protein